MPENKKLRTSPLFLPVYYQGQKSLRRGDFLPLCPKLLWRVDMGFVRAISWSEEGEAITLGVWGPGDHLGEPLMSHADFYQLECLTSAQVSCCALEQADLQRVILAHLYLTQELLRILHSKTVPLRLLLLLHWLACRFGEELEQGWNLNIRLTHQVLSEMVGTTRVTVTQMLKALETEEKLQFLDNRSFFLPRKALQPYITHSPQNWRSVGELSGKKASAHTEPLALPGHRR